MLLERVNAPPRVVPEPLRRCYHGRVDLATSTPEGPPNSSSPDPLTEGAAWRIVTRAILFTLLVLVLLWLTVRLQDVVIQVLLSVILAAGMTPVVNRLTRPVRLTHRPAWRPPRALVVLLLYVTLVAAIVLLAAVIVPPVLSEVEELVRGLPAYVSTFQTWLETLPQSYPFLPQLDVREGLGRQITNGAAALAAVAGQALVLVRVALSVLSGALNGIFILILALYITEDSGRVRDYFLRFLPPQRRAQAAGVALRIGDRLGGWLRGQILLSLIIGGMTLVGLLVIGVPYAVLLALIAAVGEAVPMIGPIFSAVPAVIIAFFQSPLQGFLALGLYVLIQQLENNLVVPKVMERAVSLHPLAVMLALLAGSELLGVTGAILSVPVTAALAVIIDEVRREREARYVQETGETVLAPRTQQPEQDPEPHGGHQDG